VYKGNGDVGEADRGEPMGRPFSRSSSLLDPSATDFGGSRGAT
jgi:hypothetical protein